MKWIRRLARYRRVLVMVGAMLGILLLFSMLFGNPPAPEANQAAGNRSGGPSPGPGVGGMALRVIASVVLLIGILYCF